MQIGFKVWQDILNGKETNELYYSFYLFFMIACCSIVLKVIIYYLIFNKLQKHKLYSSLQKLYELIKQKNININLCQLAEKAMINYCPNIIYSIIDSPSLFIESIYNKNIKLPFFKLMIIIFILYFIK